MKNIRVATLVLLFVILLEALSIARCSNQKLEDTTLLNTGDQKGYQNVIIS